MGRAEAIQAAVEELRALNGQDPNQLEVDGQLRPKELVQADRLAAWVRRLEPQASVPLQLAAHCQHLMRWKVPRSDYPAGRVGYLKWRKDLAKQHAEWASQVLRRHELGEDVIERVRQINLKQGLKSNPDSQTMEDALCLSFLEHEFAEFAAKHPDDKVIDIVQKTWRKMSERAHTLALELPLSGRSATLIQRALS